MYLSYTKKIKFLRCKKKRVAFYFFQLISELQFFNKLAYSKLANNIIFETFYNLYF